MKMRRTIDMSADGRIVGVRGGLPLSWTVAAGVLAVTFMSGLLLGALMLLSLAALAVPIAAVIVLLLVGRASRRARPLPAPPTSPAALIRTHER